jgi:phage shock protein A
MSFFRKLNTLVKAQLNDIIDIGSDEKTSRARRKFLARHDVGENLQNDAKMLRQRIDDALAYQDNLQAKINGLYDSITEWDGKADQAVADGRETDARFALGRMQQAQRELEIAESALREHQIVTQELISQVNDLEAVLEQAQQQKSSQDNSTGHSVNVQIEDDEDEAESLVQNIHEKLDETRRSIGQLIASRTAPTMPDDMEIVDEVPQPSHVIDQRKVDDDLANRRARLSRPPQKPDEQG